MSELWNNTRLQRLQEQRGHENFMPLPVPLSSVRGHNNRTAVALPVLQFCVRFQTLNVKAKLWNVSFWVDRNLFLTQCRKVPTPGRMACRHQKTSTYDHTHGAIHPDPMACVWHCFHTGADSVSIWPNCSQVPLGLLPSSALTFRLFLSVSASPSFNKNPARLI